MTAYLSSSTMVAATKSMTEEEFLALPDDGIERWLVGGEVKEWGKPTQNKFHSIAMSKVAQKLTNWRDTLPEPRGEVYTGDAAFRLPTDPPMIVGADVAYANALAISKDFPNSRVFQGAPTLAVEILSLSDTQERIFEKLKSYLAGGTAMVWTIDLQIKFIGVHRPKQDPVFYNITQELIADPILPGFRVAVADLLV